MPTSQVRNVLLRVLFDPDFHQLLVTDPVSALKEYNLTEEETQILAKPGPELYRFVKAFDPTGSPFRDEPPPPPTTVTVVIVVAIIVFVTAIAARVGPVGSEDIEKYRPLLTAIQKSSGPVRYDLVRTLVNELTKGQ